VRLEAYRRLAAAQSDAEVDDVRSEWEDRFGPPPQPVRALLDVARLRAVCLRLGITDLAVTVPRGGMRRPAGEGAATAKLSPITLPASAEIRLRRLNPQATYNADLHRLLLPLSLPTEGTDLAGTLIAFLDELVPPEGGSSADRSGDRGGGARPDARKKTDTSLAGGKSR
jgi:transcription-repair coupling factor (superfamily II helicase)